MGTNNVNSRREMPGTRQRQVAGLIDRSRHPWYPALAADLLRGAPKLGASEPEITALLRKYGLKTD
jgi:hypothetical protein